MSRTSDTPHTYTMLARAQSMGSIVSDSSPNEGGPVEDKKSVGGSSDDFLRDLHSRTANIEGAAAPQCKH